LNLTYEVTRNFTPAHHYQTLQGIADGAGLDFMTVTRMSMIPELIKVRGGGVAAWLRAECAGPTQRALPPRASGWGCTPFPPPPAPPHARDAR